MRFYYSLLKYNIDECDTSIVTTKPYKCTHYKCGTGLDYNVSTREGPNQKAWVGWIQSSTMAT